MLAGRLLHRGKDVDEDCLRIRIRTGSLVQVAVPITDLDPGAAEPGVGLRGLEEHVEWQLIRRDGTESGIIVSGHEDIDIIIPGNEPAMPHGSQQGTGVEPVAQAMLLADRVEGLEQPKHDELGLAERRIAVQTVVRKLRFQW